MTESVSILHGVALCLPIIGIIVFFLLLTLDTWYPLVLAISFSPILLCLAIIGMIIAVKLPSSGGLPQIIKNLAVIVNGVTLAPFVVGIVWLFLKDT